MPTPLPLRPAIALAVLSGLLFAPGFSPLGWWPFTLVAFAPLYVAIEAQAPRRALLLGTVALWVSSCIVFRWLAGTLESFGGLPGAAAVALLIALSAYHGLRLGLSAWLAVRAEARGWAPAPAFAAAYLSSELLFPLIFPWYAATAMGSSLALLQLAELGGPLLVDLVILVPSLALGEGVRAWRRGGPLAWRTLGVGAALPLLAAGWGLLRVEQVRASFASAPEVKIGLVQPNAPIGVAPEVEALRASTQKLSSQGAALVLWPEAAVRTAYNADTYKERVPEQVTGALGVPTLFGVRVWRAGAAEGDPKLRWNSAMLADATGAIVGRYDKHELLAFGEYTPGGKYLPALAKLLTHTGTLTAGEGPQPLDWEGHRILTLICYEDILPSYVNAQVRELDPDLLVNLTNDAWFGNTGEPWIHQDEARLRAIEHRRFLVRATNSGPSGVVDPTGEATQLGGLFVAEDRVVTARFVRARTLYQTLGNAPWYLLALLSVGAAFVRRPGAAT